MSVQKPSLLPEEQPETLEECLPALTTAIQEIEELRDKYLRAAAAIENTRKQAERVATARATDRLKDLYVRLLEVADNLERALNYAAEDDPLAPGVQATLQQLLDVLRREGVVPIEVEPGEPFDPGSQEAVEIHEGDVPEVTVEAVSQPGICSMASCCGRPAWLCPDRSAPTFR